MAASETGTVAARLPRGEVIVESFFPPRIIYHGVAKEQVDHHVASCLSKNTKPPQDVCNHI
jgi:hypothetical protein